MKTWIAAAMAFIAVFGAVYYLAGRTGESSVAPAAGKPAAAPVAAPDTQRTSRSVVEPGQKPEATDPRLAALMVSPDNGLIEFVVGPEGKVIREIDKDPGSPGYRKPRRDYTYADGRVVTVTAYRYTGNEVHTARTIVTYKPDGSIDQFHESTN